MNNEIINKLRQWIAVITSLFYVFVLVKQFFIPEAPMVTIPFHVFITMGLAFLFVPLNIQNKESLFTLFFDFAAYIFCIYLAYYYWENVDRNQLRFQGIDPV
ncbi:hypothetical protein, partial [Vibrio sp.]|uniref:hypothetical protein n=1 Tax=Vibrio sp. TaxID=678 RepID=UPI003D0B70A8